MLVLGCDAGGPADGDDLEIEAVRTRWRTRGGREEDCLVGALYVNPRKGLEKRVAEEE